MVCSLLNSCASKIISNYQMTKEAVVSIPQELIQILLAVAIRDGQTPATKVLISSWPYQVLNLRTVVKIMNFSLRSIKHDIVITILNVVVGVEGCKVKFVDLQGFELNCLQMQNCLQAMINGFKPDSQCKRVIFDWSVDADNYSIVSKAMKKFSEGSQVELLCGKLSAEGLSENKLIKLIKYLKNDVAQGLNLSLNHLKNEGLIKVLPHLDRLSNLRCLDLSYNVFNLTLSNGDSLCKCFKEVFTSLRKLQDISLNYNRITGRILDIISPLKTPVRLLKLDSCYLNAGDLSFLGNTMDISNLEVLDLSGNALSSYIQSLENLLLRSGNSLIKLTLAGTSLGDHEHSLTMLTRVAKGFKKLKFFSVQFNNFGREEQVPLVCAFASIKSMNEMKITEIRDEMGIDESDEVYNLALRIGGVPRDLSKYKDALDRAGCCDMFDLEIKDEEHGDLFVDPSDYGINYANL